MHPLLGADLRCLTRLLSQNGLVSKSALPMVLAAGFSALGRLPIRLGERGLVAWQKRQMEPMPAPIFIIGHWRSGTTHLYNLLTRAEFGYVSPIAAGMPHEFLTLGRWLKPWLINMLPKTRYVDQVAVRENSPQEDEIPLGSANPISFYHGIYFPKRFKEHFERGMFLDGCSTGEIEAWKAAFTHFVEKCWLDHGQRVIIKNPTYTTRIPLLRALYPEAGFIHIYRNPYDVIRSTRRFYRALVKQFAWQAFDHLDLDLFALDGYTRMMDQLENDRQNLPNNRFIQVRYEDLEVNPLMEIKKIYGQLELGDVAAIEPLIQTYLQQITGFQKTALEVTPADRVLVEGPLARFLDRFGYVAPAF